MLPRVGAFAAGQLNCLHVIKKKWYFLFLQIFSIIYTQKGWGKKKEYWSTRTC